MRASNLYYQDRTYQTQVENVLNRSELYPYVYVDMNKLCKQLRSYLPTRRLAYRQTGWRNALMRKTVSPNPRRRWYWPILKPAR